MLPFDSHDPFPLLPEDRYTYSEAQVHSEKVDEWLGLETKKVETELWNNERRPKNPVRRTSDKEYQQLWIGLPIQSLLTPYTEIRIILNQLNLKPGQAVIDLGAGYGRMGFVIGRHFSENYFVGYEFVGARVREGNRILAPFNYQKVKLIRADLTAPDFTPDPADYYFIYDFGTPQAIEKVMQDLRTIAQKRKIAVVGRGRASRDQIERHHPWLSQVVEPQHYGHYSIYRS